MKLQRRKRKIIKLAVAQEILGVSRSTIFNMFANNELTKIQPKPGTSSPCYVYFAEVEKLAEQRGIYV